MIAERDKHQVRDLLDAAVEAGATRDAFLDAVEHRLGNEGADAARAQAAMDYAQQQAERTNALSPDRTLPADLAAATESLHRLARRMADGDWLARLCTDWPAPIAHEAVQLAEVLQGPRDDRGRRLPPSPEAALVQGRDLAEVLIKLSACVLVQALVAAGGDDARWARRATFRQGKTVGLWVQTLREAAKRVVALPAGSVPALVQAFARLLKQRLLPFAEQYPGFRNRSIGHAARALDPRETANLVALLLEGGRLPQLDGKGPSCGSLMATLETMVAAGAFADWRLRALPLAADGQGHPPDAEPIDLTGAAAMADWLADPRHDAEHHQALRLPLELLLPDGGRLALSPLAAARICRQCGRRDLLLFDALHEARRDGRFDLLDYARGHHSRVYGSAEPDLGEAIVDLDLITEAPPPELADATLRPGLGGLLGRLDERLAAVYDPSDNVKQGRPALPTGPEAATPGRFVDWLQQWRVFAAREVQRRPEPGPLICCIDGLDEATAPEAGDWPLSILPAPGALPEGLYLVMTSRPLDDPTSPGFLRERIAPLYAGDGSAVG